MELLFDEINHEYGLKVVSDTGEDSFAIKIPSVSQVLHFNNMYGYPKTAKNEMAMNFGTHIHQITKSYDEGLLSPDDLKADISYGYLQQYARFLSENKISVEISEPATRMFHKVLSYAGTPDRYVRTPDEKHGVLEIKTGSFHPANEVQVVAYKHLFLDNQFPCDYSMLVYLSDTNYKVIIVRGEEYLWDIFSSAVRLYYWKRNNRISLAGSR